MSQVGALSSAYPGWSLAEIKTLTVRERSHWMKYATWRVERRSSG